MDYWRDKRVFDPFTCRVDTQRCGETVNIHFKKRQNEKSKRKMRKWRLQDSIFQNYKCFTRMTLDLLLSIWTQLEVNKHWTNKFIATLQTTLILKFRIIYFNQKWSIWPNSDATPKNWRKLKIQLLSISESNLLLFRNNNPSDGNSKWKPLSPTFKMI